MESAIKLFENSLEWLRQNYVQFRFFTERDVVWTVQEQIRKQIDKSQLPFRVFNDYPMLAGKRRSLSADLVILDSDNSVVVAVEFKYEPSHNRKGVDIPAGKFPVVFWGDDGVGKDVKRILEFVTKGKAQVAYAIFIDEGGAFRKRLAHPHSEWSEWDNGVHVLWSKAGSGEGKYTDYENGNRARWH